MLFICNDCGFEMDFDEGEDELVDCDECGGFMSAHPELEVD